MKSKGFKKLLPLGIATGALLVSLGAPAPADAAISEYYVKGEHTYEYNADSLLDSFVGDRVLYDNYAEKADNLYAVYDDVSKAYILVDNVLDAFMGGQDVIEYTESYADAPAEMPATVKTVSVQDGAIVEEDKQIGEEEQELKVESVSAINASTVEIKFNQAVTNAPVAGTAGTLFDTSTKVLNNTNITITPVAGNTNTITAANLEAELSKDGKTLTVVTTHATEKFEGTYNIQIKKDVIATKNDADVKLKEYNSQFTIKDRTAPTVAKVEYDVDTSNTGKYIAKVKFSEPLADEGKISINGVVISSGFSFTAGKDEITIENLEGGKVYNLAIVGATDKAGNIVSPNPVTATLKPAEDTTAPSVVSVTAKGTDIVFKFSEKLDTQGTSPSEYDFKISINGASPVDVTSDELDPNDETGTTYIYDASDLVTGSFLNATVKIEKDYKDLAGNKGAEKTQTLKLVADQTAPKFVSSFVKDDKIIVKFDEEALNVSLSAVAIKYTDKDNVVKEYATATVTASDTYDFNNNGVIEEAEKNYIELTVTEADLIAANGKLLPGTFEVTIATGKVKDANNNTTTAPIKFSVNAPETGKATLELVTGNTDEVVGSPGIIEVKFNAKVTNSALNYANYKLDGNTIPSKSKLYFYGDKDLVRIELPENFVTVTGERKLSVDGIVDVDGNTLKKDGDISHVFELTENVLPVAKSASLVSDKVIKVVFSEELNAAPTTGIEVWVNTSEVALDGTTPFDLAGVDNEELDITVASTVELKETDNIVVKFLEGNDVEDKNQNGLKPVNVTVK